MATTQQLMSIQDLRSIENLELLAKQVVEGFILGLHKSPFHGFSVEFAEHRIYNPGEATRHIDWKVYGRTDKLFTKKYEEETNLRCQIVIDASSSMYFPEAEKNEQGLHINKPVSYTHLRAHETVLDIVCRLLLEKKKNTTKQIATHLISTR